MIATIRQSSGICRRTELASSPSRPLEAELVLITCYVNGSNPLLMCFYPDVNSREAGPFSQQASVQTRLDRLPPTVPDFPAEVRLIACADAATGKGNCPCLLFRESPLITATNRRR